MEASDFFIDIPITTDAVTLADDAIERLRAKWPGWEPNDGDAEVIQIETVAPLAENAATAASQVPGAVFRKYGTDLIGRPYDQGASATTTLTFNFLDTLGTTIPQDFEIDIDGVAFRVDSETTVPVGSDAVSGVEVTASITGEEGNDLVGSSVVPITADLPTLESITVDTPTANGTNAESDLDYQNNLSRDLQLQAKTLVTTRDFELWALSKAGIGRATAVNAGDRAVNVAIVDDVGEVVSTTIKNALIADYAQYRLVNTVLTVNDPTYTTIAVTYTVKAIPGYDATDLRARIDAALSELLSPSNWGLPKGPGVRTSWVNDTVVRANVIIDRIGDVEGVQYVSSVAISGSAGSASGSNWTMAGTYSLPRAGVMTGTIT